MSDMHHIIGKKRFIFRSNFILFSILIILTLSGCAQIPQKSTIKTPTNQEKTTPQQNLITLGDHAFKNTNYESAIIYYKQALQNGDDLTAYEKLAKSYEMLSQREAALNIWLNLAMTPQISDTDKNIYKLNSIENHIKLGQITAARNLLSTLSPQSQNERKAMLLNGLLFILENKPNKAETTFQNMIKINSNDQSAHINLGLTYLVFNQLEQALDIFETLDKPLIKATNLALIFFLQEQITQAEEILIRQDASSAMISTIRNYALQLRTATALERAYILFQITPVSQI